jgi:hypothetical protein
VGQANTRELRVCIFPDCYDLCRKPRSLSPALRKHFIAERAYSLCRIFLCPYLWQDVDGIVADGTFSKIPFWDRDRDRDRGGVGIEIEIEIETETEIEIERSRDREREREKSDT